MCKHGKAYRNYCYECLVAGKTKAEIAKLKEEYWNNIPNFYRDDYDGSFGNES